MNLLRHWILAHLRRFLRFYREIHTFKQQILDYFRCSRLVYAADRPVLFDDFEQKMRKLRCHADHFRAFPHLGHLFHDKCPIESRQTHIYQNEIRSERSDLCQRVRTVADCGDDFQLRLFA